MTTCSPIQIFPAHRSVFSYSSSSCYCACHLDRHHNSIANGSGRRPWDGHSWVKGYCFQVWIMILASGWIRLKPKRTKILDSILRDNFGALTSFGNKIGTSNTCDLPQPLLWLWKSTAKSGVSLFVVQGRPKKFLWAPSFYPLQIILQAHNVAIHLILPHWWITHHGKEQQKNYCINNIRGQQTSLYKLINQTSHFIPPSSQALQVLCSGE